MMEKYGNRFLDSSNDSVRKSSSKNKRKETIWGEIDIYLKNFIKIDSVFAQLFNQGVFGGKCLIDPDKLQEQDSVSQETVKIAKDQLKSLERLRDVQKIAKVFDEQIKFQIILGVENQSGINYYMPVRCMELDALTYTYQCRKISEKAKEKKNLKKYADGVPKGTKIIPVVTLVFYYGNKVWDGPLSVYDMLDISDDVKEKMKSVIPDYPMKLIDVKHMSDEEIADFSGDLKAFLLMLRKRYNPKQLTSIVARHRETWYTVSAIKGDKRYIEYINTVSDEELEGGISMDATLDYIEARGKAKGRHEGRQEGRREGRQEGRREGKAEGINKVNQLVVFLSKDGRTNDIVKAAKDRKYQEQLFIEYGLEDAGN